MAVGALVRSIGLSGLVRLASEHAEEVGSTAERMLPVLPELRRLLPGGGLRRGSTIAIHNGSASGSGGTSILFALLAAASAAGSWCAVIGLPDLGAVAAAESGIALERLALVPYPGPEWSSVVAALLDGFDVVATAPPGPVAASVATRLAARARQRGGVLVPFGQWSGADVVLDPADDDLLDRLDRATNGRGVDVALEVAGNDDAVRIAVIAARPGGTVVLAGIPATESTSFPAAVARRKGLTIKMSRRMKEMYPRATAVVGRGLVDVRPLVSHTLPLERSLEAFRAADERVGLKVIVTPSA